MNVRFAAPFVAIGWLAACQTMAAPEPASALTGKAAEGKLLADALCSGCHAVATGDVSPNPQAPTFPNIANMSELTEATLADFLRDSHNFPERMNFEVAPEDAEALAAYMITLRADDYKPSIQ